MRPEGRSELDSLYFNYPVFDAPDAPEMQGTSARRKVVIAGGGPVAMAAALALAKYNIASVVLEQKQTFNDGSRALCLSRSSFHILDRLGVLPRFLDHALGWTTGRSFFRGKEILKFDMPHSPQEKYLPMYNLQQQYIEQYLFEKMQQSDLIDMRWQSTVAGLENKGDHISLNVSTPKGDYEIESTYVLAADGAHSPMRKYCGLRLNGDNYEGRYVIVDIRMDHDYPTERRALFEPRSNPGGTILIHKQPDNIWRIDYQLKEGESENEALREENIRSRINAILKDIGHTSPWELEWWSIYSANTLCLDDYRHGNVFFIGDSAHIVPIFGVRGLNNGLADAENLGWKLARVLNGQAEEKLLDSYTPERRGATLDVFANASRSTTFMTPPTRGHALMRLAALSLSLNHDFARALANPRNMVPYTYHDSPLTCYPEHDDEFAHGPVCGEACHNAQLPDGSPHDATYILDYAGQSFTGLAFCDEAHMSKLKTLEEHCRKLDPDFKLITIGQNQAAMLSDPDHSIAQRYDAKPGCFYLLRPDLHIAGRWRTINQEEICACINAANGT